MVKSIPIIICFGISAFAAAQNAKITKNKNRNYEWPAYGRDAGGSRYAELNQINVANVSKLKVAWTYRTGELKTYEGTEAIKKAA